MKNRFKQRQRQQRTIMMMLKNGEKISQQSNAVLTPHLNTAKLGTIGHGTKRGSKKYAPISSKVIAERKRWKLMQLKRLETINSNAVLVVE